jgi:hypothetical protein
MPKCKDCEHYEQWLQLKNGYCVAILRVLKFSQDMIDNHVYADVDENFTCGAFEKKEQ